MVSVVIPTYNRYELLCEAVDSVLRQTYQDLELIIVDDGSTEDISAIAERDSRIQYLRIEHTGMPGAVRNRGVESSGGEYLAFLDSDDLWTESKLEKQVSFLEQHPETQMVYTGETWMRDGKRIRQKSFRQEGGMVFSLALRRCMIGPSTVLMRKELFDACHGFREDLEVGEDYELWLRITATEAIGYLDEPLITKRAGHGDQLSEKYGFIELFRVHGLKDLVDGDWFPTVSLRQQARAELARKYEILAKGAEKRALTHESREYRELFRFYSSS